MDANATPADRIVPPKAVLFDVYGTLLDVYSVALRAEQMFPGAGERLARAWRDKQIEYSRLVSMSGQYRPFWQLTRDALQVSAAALRLPLDAAGEDSLMNEYRHLSAFPENRAVLLALADRGVRIGVLSNGDPDMLEAAKPHHGIAFDAVISVAEANAFKPNRATYEMAAAKVGLAMDEILFVANHEFDCVGAKAAGMRTVFIDRRKRPFARWPHQPDLIVASMTELADLLA